MTTTATKAAEKLRKHGIMARTEGEFRIAFGANERVQSPQIILMSAILGETLIEREYEGKYSYQIQKL